MLVLKLVFLDDCNCDCTLCAWLTEFLTVPLLPYPCEKFLSVNKMNDFPMPCFFILTTTGTAFCLEIMKKDIFIVYIRVDLTEDSFKIRYNLVLFYLRMLYSRTHVCIFLNGKSLLAFPGQLSGGVEGGGPELALGKGAQRCHE